MEEAMVASLWCWFGGVGVPVKQRERETDEVSRGKKSDDEGEGKRSAGRRRKQGQCGALICSSGTRRSGEARSGPAGRRRRGAASGEGARA